MTWMKPGYILRNMKTYTTRSAANNQQENEQLELSRRSFFFFGSILAAKPDIIIPNAITPTPLEHKPDLYKILQMQFSTRLDGAAVLTVVYQNLTDPKQLVTKISVPDIYGNLKYGYRVPLLP